MPLFCVQLVLMISILSISCLYLSFGLLYGKLLRFPLYCYVQVARQYVLFLF